MGNWLSGPAPAKREAMLLSSQAAAAYAGPLFHDSLCKGNSYGYGLCGLPDFFPLPAGAKSAWTLRREKRAYLPHMEKSSPHLRYSAADAPPRRREGGCAQQPGCARRSPRIEQGAFARFHAKKWRLESRPPLRVWFLSHSNIIVYHKIFIVNRELHIFVSMTLPIVSLLFCGNGGCGMDRICARFRCNRSIPCKKRIRAGLLPAARRPTPFHLYLCGFPQVQ